MPGCTASRKISLLVGTALILFVLAFSPVALPANALAAEEAANQADVSSADGQESSQAPGASPEASLEPSSAEPAEASSAEAASSDQPAPAVPPSSSFRGIVANVATTQGQAMRVTAQDVDGETYLLLPSHANLESLEITLPQPYNTPVLLSATASGPFAAGPFDVRTCQRTAQGAYTAYVRYSSSMQPFVVHIVKSAGVDAMFLTSADPLKYGRAYVEKSLDHSASAAGSYALVSHDGQLAYSGDLNVIRGRGSSSWQSAKRPYQIKLDKSAPLIDGQAENSAKTWLLISNAFDETMMRNYIAYKTALAMGLSFSPDCTYVDLYYDGEYRGLYLLCEKVQTGKGRIQIDEVENYSNYGAPLDNNGTAQATNAFGYTYQYVKGAVSPALPQQSGYLMEIDAAGYTSERCWFFSSAGPVVIKSPDNLSQSQVAFASELFQRAIDEASKANGNMAAYFDMQSFARTFLANEFAKNPDWLRWASTFFYFDNADGLIYSGPVWDFDLAFGVHGFESLGEYIDTTGWASQRSMFFADNKQFLSAMRTSLTQDALPVFRCWAGTSKSKDIPTVKEASRAIASAAAMDDLVWDTARAGSVSVKLGSFDAAVDYTQRWVEERTSWLEQSAASFPKKGPAGSGLVRLAGRNALETMGAIVDRGGFAKGGTVVLTTSEGYWDALTAAGLAGFAQAPVLMTASAQLSEQTAVQLRKLAPRTIVVCGGRGAVPDAVANAARAAAAGVAWPSTGMGNAEAGGSANSSGANVIKDNTSRVVATGEAPSGSNGNGAGSAAGSTAAGTGGNAASSNAGSSANTSITATGISANSAEGRAALAKVKMIRCAGASATGTAVDVFNKAPGITQGTWARTAFACTNASYHDALAAAPVSYATGMPIFLSEGANAFSQATIDAMRSGKITAVYVVGGQGAISEAAVQQLSRAGIAVAGRLSGSTAVETSEAVARFALAKGMTATNMGVATSGGYWDSLSGAALCGSYNSVLVLVRNKESHSIDGFINENRSKIARIFLFGGKGAIDDASANAIRAAGL